MSYQPRFWPCNMHYSREYCGGVLALVLSGRHRVYKCQTCRASWNETGDPINAPKLGK